MSCLLVASIVFAGTDTKSDRDNTTRQNSTVTDKNNFKKHNPSSVSKTQLACDTLQTTFAAGNGQNGNFFDLVAVVDVRINAFSIHTTTGGDVEVYYKTGSYAGAETDSTQWTFIGTVNVVSAGSGVPTLLPIAINVDILAGDTASFYVTTTTTDVDYTNGITEFAVYNTDGFLSILEGRGVQYPFAGNYFPRIWNGIVDYCTLPLSTNTLTEKDFVTNCFLQQDFLNVDVTGSVNIDHLKVDVRNINGQLVASQSSEGKNTMTIETGQLAKGIYIADIVINQSITVQKKVSIQ